MTNQDFNKAVEQLKDEVTAQVNQILAAKQQSELNLLLTKISEQVQAELGRAAAEHRRADAEEKLASSQAELVEEARKNRVASERRQRITQEVLDRYAYLSRRLEMLIPLLQLLESTMRDYFEETADKLEYLSDQITLLTGLSIAENRDDREAQEQLLDQIVRLPDKHRNDRLIAQYHNNIQLLEEQIAQYGVTEVPLSLRNKLEAEKQRLVDILNRP